MGSTQQEKTSHSRNGNRLQRALTALPMLVLSGITFNAFTFGQSIGPVTEKILENSLFDLNGLNVQVLRKFYGIQILDDVLAHITVAFAQLQFFGDERAYWQSLLFLTEFAGIYAILFLESLRPANGRTLFAFPFLLVFLAQFGGIGSFGPLYFYFFYVLTPVGKLTSHNFLLTNWPSCAAVLPAVLLAYHAPHISSYFHPSLEARHWWNWIWQLYPVWGSIILFVLSKVLAVFRKQTPEPTSQQTQLPTIRVTIGILASINIVTWWYTMYNSAFSWPELFIPKYFSEKPQEADVALRTLLQYDYLCTVVAVFLWLGLHFRDLEANHVCKLHYGRILVLAALIGGIFGPGTLLLLVWLVREEILVARLDDDAKGE